MNTMKKTYIIPALFLNEIHGKQLIAASDEISDPKDGLNASGVEEADKDTWFESKKMDDDKNPWKDL
jgi:hypothetical protein